MPVVLLIPLSIQEHQRLLHGGNFVSRDALPTQVERLFEKIGLTYDSVFTTFEARAQAPMRATSLDAARESGMACLDPERVLRDIEVICEGPIQRTAIKSLKYINDPMEWRLSLLKFHLPANISERPAQLEKLIEGVGRDEHLELRMNRALTIADLLSYDR